MDKLVSIITPTTSSRSYFMDRLKEMIDTQIYRNLEWIVCDEEDLSIGEKLNICCENAKGDIIIRWDDDDFFTPLYVKKCVQAILSSDCDIIGLNKAYFASKEHKWVYEWKGQPKIVLGSGMCFWKSYWKNNKFKHISQGEDVNFCMKAKVNYWDGLNDFIAMIHDDNTASHLALKNPEFTLIY